MPKRTSGTRMLRTDEIAKRWNCSTKHVRQLIHDGELDAVDISSGNRTLWRVAEDEVERAERRRTAR